MSVKTVQNLLPDNCEPFTPKILILTHQQQTVFENIVGKREIAHYEQFLLFPQCFLPNQIIVSPFVHIFDIVFLFAVQLEEPKTSIWGKGLSVHLWYKGTDPKMNYHTAPTIDVHTNKIPPYMDCADWNLRVLFVHEWDCHERDGLFTDHNSYEYNGTLCATPTADKILDIRIKFLVFWPFPKLVLVFTSPQYKSFENSVNTKEIAHFPIVFSTLWENCLPFSSNWKLLSANSFSSEETEIFLHTKKLRKFNESYLNGYDCKDTLYRFEEKTFKPSLREVQVIFYSYVTMCAKLK